MCSFAWRDFGAFESEVMGAAAGQVFGQILNSLSLEGFIEGLTAPVSGIPVIG